MPDWAVAESQIHPGKGPRRVFTTRLISSPSPNTPLRCTERLNGGCGCEGLTSLPRISTLSNTSSRPCSSRGSCIPTPNPTNLPLSLWNRSDRWTGPGTILLPSGLVLAGAPELGMRLEEMTKMNAVQWVKAAEHWARVLTAGGNKTWNRRGEWALIREGGLCVSLRFILPRRVQEGMQAISRWHMDRLGWEGLLSVSWKCLVWQRMNRLQFQITASAPLHIPIQR